MKRAFIIIISLLALTSCEKKKDQHHEQILFLNLSDDPVSLDPRQVRRLKDLTVVKQLFDGLMRTGPDGGVQPAIAERVDLSEDCLTYTFHLREAYWDNGDPVMAQDFEYSWKQVLDPQFGSDYAYMLYPIKNAAKFRFGKCEASEVGIKVLNDKTLEVHLENPTPYFLELTAFPTYFPVNHQKANQSLVCNGPFCLEKWDQQSELVLKKNPTYWDSCAVFLNKIAFSIIPDPQTQSLLFEKGETDWLGPPISQNISSELLNNLREKELINSYPVSGTFWLKFNVEKAPFDHQKLRQAFSYAINRQEIIDHILQGDQVAATGPLPPCLSLHPSPVFSDEKAKKSFEEVLSEKGWTLKTFPKIALTFIPSARNVKIAELIQQNWLKVFGIKIELAAQETHLYCRTLKQGEYQVATGDWIADFNDPLSFLELFKYKSDSESGNGMNDTRWHDETFTALLDAASAESDTNLRKKMLNQAEEILIDQMPIAPIYHYSFEYIKNPNLQDVAFSALGLVDFKRAKLKD